MTNWKAKEEEGEEQLTLSGNVHPVQKNSKPLKRTAFQTMTKKKAFEGTAYQVSPRKSKYLVKIISNEMRMGSYKGIVEMAIAKAFDRDARDAREAIIG